MAVIGATQSSWCLGGTTVREPGGVPWAGDRVSWRAAPRHLLVAACRTARRTAGVNGAKRKTAPRESKAGRGTARRTAGVNGANTRTASLLLEATRGTVRRMAEANGASTGCTKSAQGGGTPHCKAHGGGKRCQHEGCPKSAVTGGTPHCIAHARGQTVPRRGLHQGRARRDGVLQGARRGQAVPDSGLLQVR
jgi:hypothetical protein